MSKEPPEDNVVKGEFGKKKKTITKKRGGNKPKNPIRDKIDNAQIVEMSGAKGKKTANKKASEKQNKELEGLSKKELELVSQCAQLDQNDRDNARRLEIWFGADMIYVLGTHWVTWTGTHWQDDESDLCARLKAQNLVDKIKYEQCFIKPTVSQEHLLKAADEAAKITSDDLTNDDRALIAKGVKAREQIAKKKTARHTFAVSSGNATKTSAMLLQAGSRLMVDRDKLDSDLNAFNVLNGTLKINKIKKYNTTLKRDYFVADVKFGKHNRDDLITKIADVEYDPKAKCPKWQEFLDQVHLDDKIKLFLQVFHGYTLLGGNVEQKLIFHYGAGANGKSVFIETLGKIMGQYRAVVSPDTIVGDSARGGQQASPDIARLFNTRVATIEELPRGSPVKEALIKSLSGGSKMTARFLLKEIFEFEPLFTAVLSGNDMPEISGTDHGIWRRLMLVHWKQTIAAEKMQADLQTQLLEERAGILNWLIEGAKIYLENGLTQYIPASMQQFADEYRSDKDPVGEFIKACVNKVDGQQVQAKDMFKAYQDWAEHNAIKPYQQTAFGRRMTGLGFKKTRKGLIYYDDCELHDVPSKFDTPTSNFPDDIKDFK